MKNIPPKNQKDRPIIKDDKDSSALKRGNDAPFSKDGLVDLNSSDISRRISAIERIERSGDKGAPHILMEHFVKEEDPKIRARIITALAIVGDQSCSGFLSESLKDPDARVRGNTVETIQKLGNIPEEELISLIAPLLRDPSNRVVANAACLLWQIGGLRMIELLRHNLTNSQDSRLRASSAYALGEIGSIQIVPILLSALDDPDELVRKNIIRSLGKTGDVEAVHALISRYPRETDSLKEQILLSIANSGEKSALNLIISVLTSPSAQENLKKSSLQALSSAIDEKNLLLILPLLDHKSAPIRHLILQACVNYGKIEIIDHLKQKFYKITDPTLKDELKDAMARIRAKNPGFPKGG